MTEHINEAPNQNNCDNKAARYLDKAAEACAGGDMVLGMHLYLAAYEQALLDGGASSSLQVMALREAWNLTCDLKERSLAEYVFEKMEPYLTGDEIAECAMKLQELALDRLEEYGFSREELEDMAETFAQDYLGGDGSLVKVESISFPALGAFGALGASDGEKRQDAAAEEPQTAQLQTLLKDDEPEASAQAAASPEEAASAERETVVEDVREPAAKDEGLPQTADGIPRPEPLARKPKPSQVAMGKADVNDFNPYAEYANYSVGTSYHAATNEGAGMYTFTRDKDRETALARAQASKAAEAQEPVELTAASASGASAEAPEAVATPASSAPASTKTDGASKVDLAKKATAGDASADAPADVSIEVPAPSDGTLTYRNLVGYDEAVGVMRDFGVGLHNNPEFMGFVRMLNSRHGLQRMPSLDTLLFRAPTIEDAARFVEATIGELGLPVLRMTIEEGMGGVPVLCVSTQGNSRPRMNHAHNRFEGPGILVLDDLDAWTMPEAPESPEGITGFMMANISRGAREAVALIQSAVEDPDVFVLATATLDGQLDPFFLDVLEPISIIDIGYPTEKERADLWAEIVREHPSLRSVDQSQLVRFSEGLARYDLFMAAREALEEAYKMGLVKRAYVPVTPQNIFDKLAVCLPLDSPRYKELEEAVLEDFRTELDDLDDLLGDQ